MNKMELLCAGVDSHINKFYSIFHTHKNFYMILQQTGETVTKYFDNFKSAGVNSEISKGKLAKHEYLEKSERDDGNNINQEKEAEDNVSHGFP